MTKPLELTEKQIEELMLFCDGRTGTLLAFRKPSPKERRLYEASQPAKNNFSTPILKRLVEQSASREDRLLKGCWMVGLDGSRKAQPIGSDLYSVRNGGSSRSGVLNTLCVRARRDEKADGECRYGGWCN